MEDQTDSKRSNKLTDLWLRYKAKGDEAARNLLLEHYLPIVRYAATRLGAKLPEEVDVDDLVSAGIFGLMDALKAYDLSREVRFEIYCAPRIRGAILDELRSMDWVPLLVRSRQHKLHEARQEITLKLGRPATDKELAQEFRISMKELKKLKRDAEAVGLISLNQKWFEVRESDEFELAAEKEEAEELEDKKTDSPSETVNKREFVELVTRGLSRTERIVIMLYYFEDMTTRDIAEMLGLSESRISHIHTSVLNRLQDILKKHTDVFVGRPITISEAPGDKNDNLAAVAEAVGVQSQSLEEPVPSNPVVEIFIELGDATSGDITRLFSALTNLYEALGGSGLRVWGGSTHVTSSAEAWV